MKEQQFATATRLCRKPTSITSSAAAVSRKIKVVCSYNGAFCARPPCNKLRYIGGDTRIVSIDRNITFSKLMSKMSDLCLNLRSFSLKYQVHLSGSGRPESDAPLVSIASDDDVWCMIEEYDTLQSYGMHSRLWVFVCSESNNNNNHKKKAFVTVNTESENSHMKDESLRKIGLLDKQSDTNDNCHQKYYPLNPRDGNRYVERNCLSGHNFEIQDLGIIGEVSLNNFNRENIMPGGSCNAAHSAGCYHNGIRNHRFSINDVRNQVRRERNNNLVDVGNHRSSVRLDGRLRPNSIISKQGQSTARLYGSNSRKLGFPENVMEGRMDMDNLSSKSKYCHLAYQGGAGTCGGNQSLLCSNDAVESLSSGVVKMESQEDLLSGSVCEKHQVPFQSVSENYPAESINNDLFMIDKKKVVSISDLLNDLRSCNGAAVECNNNLMDARIVSNVVSNLKNGTQCLGSRVTSSVDLLHNLSLSSSKRVELPAPSSLESGNPGSLLKPESVPLDVMDGQLGIGPEADQSSAVAFNFSPRNEVSMERDQVHEEGIQQDLPSGLSIDEKVETEGSIKCSKGIGGISSDLAAVYAHIATQELQTIKNSDLEYIKELGSGTYGTVYYGKWKGSDVAIKKIKPSCFSEGSLEEDRLVMDFWKEAHILGQLHHPNIVAFYGVVTDGPVKNLATVTEYMVNGSLKQVLQRKDRTIDRRKRITLAMDAAFGMEYLHEKNIVHFDLKSHNFLVNMRDPQRPVCKIGDLGLSKIKRRTLVSGGVRGTIPWMAPELLSIKNNMVSEKIDVYSFGIVMWELLTGEEPYANLRSEEIIGGIIKGSLRPEIPSWCDPMWRSLMERCWSSDPESRPAFSEITKGLRVMSEAMNIKRVQ